MDAPPAMAAAAASSVGGGDAAAAAAVASTSTGVKETSSVEETRPTSTIAGLAKEAAQLFHSRSYQGCLLILNQLLLQNEADPKIRHNIAVAEYYRDGCINPQKLLDVLVQVKGRSEELAQATEEQHDGHSPSTSTSPSLTGSGGNGAPAATPASTTSDVVAYMENYDSSIPTLNTAVMMYHLQQYADGMSVLEPLYRNIEPIDETAALRVCLLMLDITLASRQPAKAAEVLQYMEKAFGYLLSPADSGNPAPIKERLAAPAETESLLNSAEPILTRTPSEEGLEEEALTLGELDMEPSQVITSQVVATPVVTLREKAVPSVDLKLVLHLYKARFFLLAGNLKATKREIKSALNLSRDHLTALLLKAQLEYSRGNYRKAIKQLTACNSSIGRGEQGGMNAMVLSNLGCIHHRLRKEQTAALYFTKALQSCTSSNISQPRSLPKFSQDRSLAIVYNAGLQQLSCGNPVLAARCFQEAAALYYTRPLLWLRLAECCILALEKGLLAQTSIKREEVKVTVVGEGKWRRVLLPTGSLNPTVGSAKLRLELDDDVVEGAESHIAEEGGKWFVAGQPYELSLAFAIRCLRTALSLFDQHEAKAAEAVAAAAAAEVKDGDDGGKPMDKKGGASNTAGSPAGEGKDSKGIVAAVTAYENQRGHETAGLRVWALSALAYCQLGIEHPLQALHSAEELLRQPACARPYTLLAHIYAAEALCQLQRPREAADHLSTCLVESSTTATEPSSSGAEEESLKWKSGDNSEASGDGEDSTTYPVGALGDAVSVARLTGSRARALLFVNLSAVYGMQGDFQQAHQWATQAFTITPTNAVAMLAVVYAELLMGRAEEAVALLKHCRHLCVVSPSNGSWQRE
ncbi:hypothetical protein CY35_07G065200 [Sphagnum magellanicum]|uniref:Uncharacterized protein n=1 Tax=Sphagnum magellanicum TaxID=128215 RepID=A0ACB8HLD5_9BRYO|nr:hypothetical protein CY35_07G065200 [Sphagnum magellanicum]